MTKAPMTQPTEAQTNIVERLLDEADLCQNEGAEDIATLLSEAAAEITRLRTELAEARLQGRREGLEAGARVADRRAEDRFAEYGVTEPDTNASYYDGRRAEALDELDEEDWAIRDAIRAIDPATLMKDADEVEIPAISNGD